MLLMTYSWTALEFSIQSKILDLVVQYSNAVHDLVMNSISIQYSV